MEEKREKKYYLPWCWIGWIVLLGVTGTVLIMFVPYGRILYLVFLLYILYMSVISIGVYEAKTLVLKGTKIPVLILKGPRITIIPYPILQIDYTVNLSTRKLSIGKLLFYDKDGFEIAIQGHIEIRVIDIFKWCYEFLGGYSISEKERVIVENFGDAFQTLITNYGLPITEIEKLRGPEVYALIFKGIKIAGRPFDPAEFEGYRKNAERQGWEPLTIIFGSFEERGKTREIREEQAIAAAKEWTLGRLGRAEGQKMKREAREAIWEIAKALAGCGLKKDSELTPEEIERASGKTAEAFQEYVRLKALQTIRDTDKMVFTPSGKQIPLMLSPPTTEEKKGKRRRTF